MLSPHVVLKLIGTFTVFVLSLVGYVLPLNAERILYARYYTRDVNWTEGSFYHNLKAFSSGIILGVALIHLIAESTESLQELSEYPVALLVSGIGLIFSIGIDQMAVHCIHQEPDVSLSNGNSINSGDMRLDAGHDDEDYYEEHGAENVPLKHFAVEALAVISGEAADHGRKSSEAEAIAVAKLYVLEAAIAIHSVIIGFGFGVMDPVETLNKAAALITAFSFHQFFEGIGLSTTILSTLTMKQNSRSLTISFGLIFSLTFPLGAMIGLYNLSDTYESLVLQGLVNAFAGGVLLHSSLVEMISVDFSKPQLNRKPFLKMCMFLSLVFGFLFMVTLALFE